MSLTRFCLVVLVLSAASGTACFAQDAAMQAAQQANDAAMQAAQQANDAAMQAAQQANQQMMQASQQANQDAMNAMQQAQMNAQSSGNDCCAQTNKPKFTVKPGKYSSARTVRIEDGTPHAIIFYTTDGWTPTQRSPRYSGPISIASTTMLQAIAVAPGLPQSPIVTGIYTIKGAPLEPCGAQTMRGPADGPANVTADTIAAQRVPVPLAFTSEIDTAKAEVGDSIPLTLARDVQVNGAVIVPKGTPAVATVTQVTRAGLNASPGTISFRVQSLDLNGKSIRLHGGDTMEASKKNRAPFYALMFVPFAGPFIGASSLLVHGNNAVIEPGACVTAFLDANLPASQQMRIVP
ncbi:MAG: chitobiase/beta-hexosaminidase C-terminal domain-containing protein [Acidobacteriaceae bacterium]